MTKHNRSLSHYLETPQGEGLTGLLQHLNYLQTLAPLLHETLPTVLASQCQLANYRQGRLIISVSNQAIATRLRFVLPDLRQQLRKYPAFAGLIGIDFYIAKPTIQATNTSTTSPYLRAPVTLDAAQNPAENIMDKHLQACWQQLVQHATVTK